MHENKNVRRANVLVAALGTLLVGATGLALVTAGTEAPTDEAVIESTIDGVCPADWAPADTAEGAILAPGGNPCKDCKKSPDGHRCTRISCDPCCWSCLGEPYPICSS